MGSAAGSSSRTTISRSRPERSAPMNRSRPSPGMTRRGLRSAWAMSSSRTPCLRHCPRSPPRQASLVHVGRQGDLVAIAIAITLAPNRRNPWSGQPRDTTSRVRRPLWAHRLAGPSDRRALLHLECHGFCTTLQPMPARTPRPRRTGLACQLGVRSAAAAERPTLQEERALDVGARATSHTAAAEAASRTPTTAGLAIPGAAAALGVSVRTLRRRLAAGELAVDARTPWGAQAITEQEIARHRAARRPDRGGRPRVVSDEVAARAAELRAGGLSYARVGAALEADGVPTAHGGRRWWASSVRALLERVPAGTTDGVHKPHHR